MYHACFFWITKEFRRQGVFEGQFKKRKINFLNRNPNLKLPNPEIPANNLLLAHLHTPLQYLTTSVRIRSQGEGRFKVSSVERISTPSADHTNPSPPRVVHVKRHLNP
ncbi:hypothetical protein VTJ04DRAFT_2666 [Mycothermus thermophilus]|uniref:uncharacterized protein n=1 Tax=Humicola insolens TaxID=85995 RepID=UPI0037421DF3